MEGGQTGAGCRLTRSAIILLSRELGAVFDKGKEVSQKKGTRKKLWMTKPLLQGSYE